MTHELSIVFTIELRLPMRKTFMKKIIELPSIAAHLNSVTREATPISQDERQFDDKTRSTSTGKLDNGIVNRVVRWQKRFQVDVAVRL